MAVIESIATGLWSAGSTWDSDPAIPVNGDTVNINSPHVVTFDVDQSGFAAGVTLTIDDGATLICATGAGTYYLMTSANITLNGTLQAGTDTGTPLPLAAKFTIDFNAQTRSIECSATGAILLYCTQPTNKYILATEALSIGEGDAPDGITVDTDVTADIWAVGDTVAVIDTTAVAAADSEFLIIAAGGIAAGELTFDAPGLTKAKDTGAMLGLVTRNIRIINNGTDYCITYINVTTAGNDDHIGAELNTGGHGIYQGNDYEFSGVTAATFSMVRVAYNATFSGCAFHISGASTSSGLYASWGCTLTEDGLIAGIGTATSISKGSTIEGLIFGCSTGITDNNFNLTSTGSICYCSSAILAASGVVYGAFVGNSNDIVDSPSVTVANTTLSGGNALLRVVNAKIYNTIFTNTEYSDYTSLGRSANSYVESTDHDQVVNAFKAWCRGGIVTSQTASPPTGYTVWYEHACEDVDYPCFRQFETIVQPDTAIEVTGQIRIADAADHSTYPPALQIVDKFADPLVDSTASYLDTDAVATADGTEAGWQVVDVIWANSGDAPRQVIVRMYAQHASGDVDEVWSIADYQTQIQTLYDDWADGGRLDLIQDAILVDTGTTIPALITAAGPQTHNCDSVTDTTGTVVVAGHTNTHTDDGVLYYQVAPETPADGDGFGLSQTFVFTIGVGRTPNALNVNGYFNAAAPNADNRAVEVWAYNYTTTAWEQLSNIGNHLGDEASDQDYQYVFSEGHYQISDGEIQVRFTSTSVNVSDDLYLDHLVVSSVAQAAAGLTAEAIANANWHHDVSDHDGGYSAGGILYSQVVFSGLVTTVGSTTSFTSSTLPAVADIYNGYVIQVHDLSTLRQEAKVITDMDNAGVVTLDSALSFTPAVGDHLHIRTIVSSERIETIIAKLPDDYIMGSSVTTSMDDEINSILAAIGQVHTVDDETPGGGGGGAGIAEGC